MRAFFAWLVIAIILYFVFSLCAWSLVPGHWGGFWRGLWVVALIAFGVFAYQHRDELED